MNGLYLTGSYLKHGAPQIRNHAREKLMIREPMLKSRYVVSGGSKVLSDMSNAEVVTVAHDHTILARDDCKVLLMAELHKSGLAELGSTLADKVGLPRQFAQTLMNEMDKDDWPFVRRSELDCNCYESVLDDVYPDLDESVMSEA